MKEKLLLLCTCTYLEIMTAVGITAYLVYLDKLELAAISAGVFSPFILFHFLVERMSKNEGSEFKKQRSRVG